MKTPSSLLVLSSVLLGGVADATPEREALARAVGLIDQLPTKAQLIALGADPEGRGLLEIANDPSRSVYVRVRAVSFLAWFDSEPSRAGLSRIANDEGSPVLELRVQALRSLALMEGPLARAKIEPYLDHSSAELRAAAARALALIRAAESPSVEPREGSRPGQKRSLPR